MAEQAETQPERKFIKRGPSVDLTVKDLNSKSVPPRVAVAGTIVNKNEELYSFLIDDGTGTVLVITNNIERFNEIKESQFVRVLGKTWGEGEELEIQADIIQDFSKVNPAIYRQVIQ